MLPAPVRYACLAAMLICNALFFWNVEVRTDALVAFAFGESPAPRAGATQVTQTQMKQSSSYTFAKPAQFDRAAH
jgi:hypothetical protein